MMNSRRFDVPRFLARQKPKAVGIDLHWLPHAHGALEIARIVKELHPDVPVIFGGLSSSYFHRELIGYPQVDFVMRGDSTEPPLHSCCWRCGRASPSPRFPISPGKMPAGFTSIPIPSCRRAWDYVRPAAGSHGRDGDAVPRSAQRPALQRLVEQPITTVFTVKGCAFECVTCGASHTSCTHLMKRHKPVYRCPASLVLNMRAFSRLSHGPIVLIGDLLMAGPEHAAEVLERLREADFPNEIVFEFFALPPASFLCDIDRSVRHWSMEFSPESHDQGVRDAQEGEAGYTTEDMEALFKVALSLRCSRIDVYFMIGLPAQTGRWCATPVEYCGRLFQLGDKRLSCFISPMGPFIDPGSRGFEEPDRFGYRLFAHTLEGAPSAAHPAQLGAYSQL